MSGLSFATLKGSRFRNPGNVRETAPRRAPALIRLRLLCVYQGMLARTSVESGVVRDRREAEGTSGSRPGHRVD